MNQHDTKEPRISLVMPVYNEAPYIRELLEQIAQQSLANSDYEVIVVDGMSSDTTIAEVESCRALLPRLRVLTNPGRTSARGRNIGATAARSPYILFIDGHCRIMHRTMLEDVLAAFESGFRCVSRPQPFLTDTDNPFQSAIAAARQSMLGHNASSLIHCHKTIECDPTSAGCGYEKKTYWQYGGIDEAFDAGEDLDLNLRLHRAGIRAWHAENFAVAYYPRSGPRGLALQMYRYGYGRARVAFKNARAWSPMVALLAVFIIVIACMTCAWAAGMFSYMVPAMAVAAYVTTVAIASIAIAQPIAWSLWWRVAVSLFAIHLGGGAGYLAGLMRFSFPGARLFSVIAPLDEEPS